MSIRSALIVAMLGVVILSGVILGAMGVTGIDRDVIREAQSRVDHDLRVVGNLYQRRLELLADRGPTGPGLSTHGT